MLRPTSRQSRCICLLTLQLQPSSPPPVDIWTSVRSVCLLPATKLSTRQLNEFWSCGVLYRYVVRLCLLVGFLCCPPARNSKLFSPPRGMRKESNIRDERASGTTSRSIRDERWRCHVIQNYIKAGYRPILFC